MNPGIAYVAKTYQVGIEAIVPLNSEGGRNVGMRAQLLLFLDDLLPSIFGKPIFDVSPKARASEDYIALTKELLKRM